MALKDEMPQTAAWIAELRAAFCETQADLAAFNAQIKAGIDGQPTFYACENGREVGTKDQRQGVMPTLPFKPQQAPDMAQLKGWK